jgi:hypothetical protein
MSNEAPFLTPEQTERVSRVLYEDSSAYHALQTPEELHALADCFNWDDDLDVLVWIAKHPLCDRATALRIFWCGDLPYYYQDQNLGDEEQVQAVAQAVTTRLLADQYPTENYYFNPAEDYDLDNFPEFPEALTRPARGKKVTVSV